MTVFGSAVEVVEQYVAEIRPCFGAPRHPAMFLTERSTRIALAYINVALVGAPNLTAMNARSRSETRLSPRLQVFVPPNVGPSPDVSAKFSHRRGVSLKRDSLPLPPQSERADGGAVAPARDDEVTSLGLV